ncbi:MAG: LTA synthase family protein [Ruminococcaceae bacterium]|nr:LTA synthase family protein [Oscillospiraceae bacterium]
MKALLYGDTFPRLWQNTKDDPGKWLSRLVYLLGPWFCFFMVEFLNKNDLIEDFAPWQVFFNLIWYYILFYLARLLLGRRRRAGVFITLLCFAVGLVNHYVLRFRGRIIFPADLQAWRTAANVLDGFDLSFDIYVNHALILLIAYLFLLFICPAQKKRDSSPRLLSLLLALSTAAYTYAFFFTGMLPALNIYTQQWVTQANGFLLNFTVALRYSRLEKPAGWSEQAALDIMDAYSPTLADETVTHPTNIIVVMNEAFSDLTIFDTLDVSEDPTPFLHSMEENTIKGLMYPPVTGGGTASVEYEFLTGLSNSFLPPHCVAYQLYMNKDMPSLSTLAASSGFSSTAFHPYHSTGWNRPIVYDYLDFDTQLYNTDVTSPRYVRRYISDQRNYEILYDLTSRTASKPNFIFNVTMQNHSGYAQGWSNLPKSITLSEELDKADPKAQQYFCLMKVSDNALSELIAHYEQVNEPTLIVFFGDHQPSLSNEFYEALYDKKLNERTTEEILKQYAVPFFLWANYDIPEQQNVVISSNFLGMLTAKTAGLPLTGWMNFLSDLHDRIPVITPVGYITADGTVVKDFDQLSPEQQDWLHKYEMLAYSAIKNVSENNASFFHLPQ